jgi:carboxymethylenebutenolidase
MVIKSIRYDDVPLRIGRPAGDPTSAVIVLHQAAGWSPQITGWLERLAGQGHLAVAPSLLHRHGVDSIDPFARFGGDMEAFAAFLPGDDDVRSDVASALRFIVEQGVAPPATGVLGFSFGGRASYLVATETSLGAAVSFYGNGIQQESFQGNDALPALADRTGALRTPWLGLYGEQDFLLAPGELDEWEKQLAGAPVATELVRYPDAGHAFDVEEAFGPGMPVRYVAEAAEDATARTLAFFENSLT